MAWTRRVLRDITVLLQEDEEMLGLVVVVGAFLLGAQVMVSLSFNPSGSKRGVSIGVILRLSAGACSTLLGGGYG